VNLLEARVALRPRAVSDILDLSGPFCMVHRRLLAPLALLTTAAGGLLALVCRRWLGWSWATTWMAVAVTLLVANGLFTQAVGELLFGAPEDLRVLGIARTFARRLLPFLAARTIQLLALGACALVVVPLPIFAARLFFVSEVVLLESGAPVASLARSSRLVLYRSLPCLGLALACACAPFLGAMAADWIGDTVVNTVFQMGQPFGSLWSDGGSAYAVAGALLSAPFVASASFLGYIDLRTRKEGWDIQLRLAALADSEDRLRVRRQDLHGKVAP
jgi:hypothetical protein